MTQEEAQQALIGITDSVVVLGLRSATSKYGEYDDIIGLFTPEEYIEYKGNTLPSKWTVGIAKLMPGDYKYRKGLHGIHHLSLPANAAIASWLNVNIGKDYTPIAGRLLPYWALRQAAPVKVLRCGATETEIQQAPANWPWIDIHHGGYNLTSSEGCQTLFPDHWLDFRARVYGSMTQYNQSTVTYRLIQQ